ncbi:hypothetical protein [Arthrobacter sp. PM3]|uniref:hypothetical protein n=1 Tax=Arthrobacter sp. PM3 TaxID=2017685 RepID=UPI0021C2BD30|nr:hypothetical protein [Arthrobacter sp. PM3]
MDSLIIGGVVLIATIAVMVLVPTEQTWPKVIALLAGIAVGVWLVRFAPPWRWLSPVVLVLFIGVWFALGGVPGIAWFGGFIAGANFGAAWTKAVKHRMVKAEWTVDDLELNTVAEARKAANAALKALDGKAGGRLVVEHGAARFEVAGGVGLGMVCHRNSDASDERSWAVLVRPGQPTDKAVEVPMGDVKGLIPSRLVNELGPVEAALADFLKNPGSSSLGPEWETGSDAEATRLTTH